MMRSAPFALLLALATSASAAPVPKEVKAAASTVGTWQIVGLDPENPARRIPSNQYWIIDAECGVIFCQSPSPPRGAKPTEIFKFDPKTGYVDHNLVAGKQRTLFGLYELKDDLLTICLETSGTTRPSAFEESADIWHLQRVKGAR